MVDCQMLAILPLQVRLFRNEAYSAIAVGDYGRALTIAEGLSQLPRDRTTDLMIGAIRIDTGSVLRNPTEVHKGIDLLERYKDVYSVEGVDEATACAFFYNLANGYYSLTGAKRANDNTYYLFTRSEYESAKKYYRKAAALTPPTPELATQLNVNLANCLDELGRGLDALEYYEKALAITPDFAMAFGNKGQCLWHYAEISGKQKVITYSESHNLLDEALKRPLTLKAKRDFEWYRKDIERKLGPRLMKPPFAPKFVNPGTTQVERDWIQFGLEHRLHLNACNYCPTRCGAAIEDSFTLEKMVAQIGDESFLRYQDWFNQIRFAYATTRYLLFLAITDPHDDDSFLDRVLRAETYDYSVCDLQTELLKICYKSFYGILDELAFILNDYLRLGEPFDKISFNNIWYVNRKIGQGVRPEFINTNSKALNGLFNINLDLERDGDYYYLREMRNCLTHRFVTVAEFCPESTAESMDEEELWDRTFELARITRNAVAYLIFYLWKDSERQAV